MKNRFSLSPVVVFAGLVSLVWAQDAMGQAQRIEWKTQRLTKDFYSEGATVGDFNKDGVLDIASGPFWYPGPDFKAAHQFYAQDRVDPHGYSNNFFSFTDDFNQDGWDDILVYGFPGADASWFENPKGADRFWPRHKVMDVVDNESPQYLDLNGDGKREIVCSSGGFYGFAEVDWQSPESPWKFRRISDNTAGQRFTHGLGVGDVNGDGRADLLERTGWWEQPESLDGDPQWKKHSYPFSPSASQIHTEDVDGDGDADVIAVQNAHGFGLCWFEQVKGDDGKTTFKKHVIMGSTPKENPYGVVFSQPHALEMVDIDGDGLRDILTGKRYWAHGPHGDAQPNHPAVLYWFQLARDESGEVRWIPHLIDDDSGVGTEVNYADVDKDGLIDVVVGNKKGTFVHLQRRREVSAQETLRDQAVDDRSSAKPASDKLPPNAGLLPEEAAEAMTVPQGFSVALAAGEPMVHQPIAMTFDQRGRLWVAEAHTYPVRAPDGEGKDKIIILEDTDQDGDFDRRKIFIEGLNLVSGMELGFGGVWVGAPPFLMFIPDQDGDDVPDSKPQILLDGFGYQDTHETLNSFTWGPDGWLYGCHGVFTHSRVGKPGTPDEQRIPLNCGVWRYHPTKHQFDVFARGTSNPWGVDFNDYGQAFITACVIPHIYHMIQGARYQRQGGQHFNPHIYEDIKTIADHAHYAGNIRDHAWWGRNEAVESHGTHEAGGGHAHCGAMIYLGNNWPRQYRNSIFMTNLLGNRLNNDILSRVGSGYVASHGRDFLFANDLWFRCISQKIAPDGSVYLIDWYDKQACHRRDRELWDRTNGRVFQVRYGQPTPWTTDLGRLADAELVKLLTHENEWQVRMAKRLLQERSHENKLNRAVVQSQLEAIVLNHPKVPTRLRGLWALHSCGMLTEKIITALLDADQHHSEYLRCWAIQLDLEDGEPIDLARYEQMARNESSPIVRLYLASALQRLPVENRVNIAKGLVMHADDANDHNLPLLIWYGVEPIVTADTTAAWEIAASSRMPQVRKFIYRRAASDSVAINHLLANLSKVGDDPTRKMILEEITAAISKLGQLEMPKDWPQVYAVLAQSEDASVRQQAQMITVRFGDASIFPVLRGIVGDGKATVDSRVMALQALLAGRDDQLPPLLISLLKDRHVRGHAIRGLARFNDESIPVALLGQYASFSDEERSDVVATLTSRAPFAVALLDAVERETVPRSDLTAFHVRQLSLIDDEELAATINRVWGTMRRTSADKKKRIEELKATFTPEVLANANLSNGRALYQKSCGTCHRLFGQGGAIGPDITGSNRGDLDYTLQNIIDPNALVGKDYQATQLLTLDGRVITGLLREENDSAVVIQTANEKLVVSKRDIEQRQLAATSVMPEGQLDQLSKNEVRDLIAYLASSSQVPLPGEGPAFGANNRIHGAIEGESLRVIRKTGKPAPQGMKLFTRGQNRWSGDSHLWWIQGKVGDELRLAVPVSEAGEYEVYLGMTKAGDYGIVEVSLNDGKPMTIDLFDTQVIPTGPVSIGMHTLTQGDAELSVKIKGANPKAVKGYMFGLDYIYLANPKKSSQE